MPILIDRYDDRDRAHTRLVELLASGDHPRAECRENHNSDLPYEVWDSPEYKDPGVPAPVDEESLLERLAARLTEKLGL